MKQSLKYLKNAFIQPLVSSCKFALKELQKHQEYEQQLCNLSKITGETLEVSRVTIDLLKERFTEDKREIISILLNYAINRASTINEIERHVFKHPIDFYKGKDISLRYYLSTL